MAPFQDVLIARVNAARKEAAELKIALARVTRERDRFKAAYEESQDELAELRRSEAAAFWNRVAPGQQP